MTNNSKKVLIISCNCLSETSNNGKTLLNLFKEFPSNNISQFYTYNEKPDFKHDFKLYQITDQDMISFKFNNSNTCGRVIHDYSNISTTHISKGKYFENFKRVLRDLIWMGNSWYYKGLLQWFENNAPDFIFFVGINNPYLYKLCHFLQNKYNLPVLIYNTDDYLCGYLNFSPSFWFRLIVLRNNFTKLMRDPRTRMLTINEVMKKKYKELFNYDSKILTNFIESEYSDYVPSTNKCKKIVYIGNLLHNRWKSVALLANLMKPFKKRYKFYIYPGNSINDKIRVKLEKFDNLVIGKNLNNRAVINVIKNADYVLHVESFAHADVILARYSLSTKITEYAAYCKPIIAFCPEDVASYKILKNNKLAICLSADLKNVDDFLQKLENNEYLKSIVKNAYDYFNNLRIEYNMDHLVDSEIEEILSTMSG